MSTPGFSVDQLMELAGLSVAQAAAAASPKRGKVVIIAGPGNNGGDGLVAARHLYHFGYSPLVVYPKPGKSALFQNLQAQLGELGVKVLEDMPPDWDDACVLAIDAVLGFSAKGAPRQPFSDMLNKLRDGVVPTFAVDIPSGWDVEEGDIHKIGFMPDFLISLTAPKKCARHFTGRHFLGGRFVPPGIVKEYNLEGLPQYPDTAQYTV